MCSSGRVKRWWKWPEQERKKVSEVSGIHPHQREHQQRSRAVVWAEAAACVCVAYILHHNTNATREKSERAVQSATLRRLTSGKIVQSAAGVVLTTLAALISKLTQFPKKHL